MFLYRSTSTERDGLMLCIPNNFYSKDMFLTADNASYLTIKGMYINFDVSVYVIKILFNPNGNTKDFIKIPLLVPKLFNNLCFKGISQRQN